MFNQTSINDIFPKKSSINDSEFNINIEKKVGIERYFNNNSNNVDDTSANNISTDPSDLDTNGVRDIYKIDLSLNTLERISLSTGLEADQHVKLVGVTEANNGSDIIIFETIANTFSNQDTNDLFDIYQLSTNQNSSDLSLVSISTQNNASGIVNEQVLIENGSIYFEVNQNYIGQIKTLLIGYDFDIIKDLYGHKRFVVIKT